MNKPTFETVPVTFESDNISYVDSMTPEEREADSKIGVTTTTASALDLAKNNSNQLELRKMFDNYSRVYALEEACGECELCVDNEEVMQEIIQEVTKQIQSDLLKEVKHIIEQEVMWYNTNNHIPDSELKENDKHWEKLQKIVKDSLKEVGENINKDIKKLAEEKGIIINK